MTKSELEILRLVRAGARRGPLPRDYFDTFPGQRRIAKNLMWDGYIENCGMDRICLTPAGEHSLRGR